MYYNFSILCGRNGISSTFGRRENIPIIYNNVFMNKNPEKMFTNLEHITCY